MARLQIVPLPPKPGRPAPYAVVIDQVDEEDIADASSAENEWRRIRDRMGADAVLFFAFTVDVVNTLTAAAEATTYPPPNTPSCPPQDIQSTPCCAQQDTRVTS